VVCIQDGTLLGDHVLLLPLGTTAPTVRLYRYQTALVHEPHLSSRLHDGSHLLDVARLVGTATQASKSSDAPPFRRPCPNLRVRNLSLARQKVTPHASRDRRLGRIATAALGVAGLCLNTVVLIGEAKRQHRLIRRRGFDRS